MIGLSRVCILFFVLLSVRANAELWVTPTFPASEVKASAVTLQTHYRYTVQTPKVGFEKANLKQKKYSSMDSAEEAFIARMSAISSLDYPWWLETWEESSLNLAKDMFKQKGLTSDYWIDTWKRQFVGRKITYVKKVNYQNYQVIIYNVSAPNGQPGFFDLPVVFKQLGDDSWRVSLDLRANPLLRISPWVEGIDRKEEVYE